MVSKLISFAGIIALLLMVIIAGEIPAQTGDLILTRNGKSDYTIVLSRQAFPSEKHAARELQKYLKMISGVTIPVQRDNETVAGPMILVGNGPLLRQIDASIDFDHLGKEGFIIRTRGPHILIAGGHERGTMYGVYDFLEDVLGCKWYTHEASYIPQKTNIQVGILDIKEKPAFVQRMLNARDATTDANWAVRNRLNTGARLGEIHGGSVVYQGGHSTYILVSPYRHFESHPEYYSLLRGKRQWEHAQICASNPEVAKVTSQSMLEWIARQPEGVAYNIGQEDWNNWCLCPECAAVNDYEESAAGTNILLANRVAEAVEKTYPDKLVGTFAYLYTLIPPKHMKARDNVAIRLAIIAGCDGHPLEICPMNANIKRSVTGWAAVCKNVFIWDYTNNFSHLLTPFPNWWSNHEDLMLFSRVGIAGVFMQGCSYTESGGLEELQTYVQSKLLWNPEQDVWRLVDEFLAGYYGPAAPHMRQYIDLLQNKVRNLRVHFNLASPPSMEYLSPEIIHASEKILTAALHAARGNPEILHRIETDRLCLRYVKLTQPLDHVLEGGTFKPRMTTADYDDIDVREVHDFMEASRHHEITALNEWGEIFYRERHIEVNLQSHEIVSIENALLKVDVIPSIGGRIHGIYDKKNNRELLSELKMNKNSKPSWNPLSPVDGWLIGDDPISGREFRYHRGTYLEEGMQFGDADQEEFWPQFVNSVSGSGLVLTGFLTKNGHGRIWNSFLERREFTLPAGTSGLKIRSVFTALIPIQRPWSRGVRQTLNLGNVADGLRVGIARQGGGYIWEDVVLTPDAPLIYSRIFSEREIRQGSMIVINPIDNIGVVAEFNPEQLTACGVSVNAVGNTVNILLYGRHITYRKGDTWTLTHSYSYLDDASKFTN